MVAKRLGLGASLLASVIVIGKVGGNLVATHTFLGIPKQEIAKLLGKKLPAQDPADLEAMGISNYHATIDPTFQAYIKDELKKARVPYASFVAIEPSTGKVLAMASYSYDKKLREQNLSLKATFPSASVFKVITAAAALEAGKLNKDSLIPVRGSYHTLYKNNLFKGGGLGESNSEAFRKISFSQALAKSVNSVFGKIGIFGVGSQGLRKMADQFAFGREIPFELNADESHAKVPEDAFGLAESASGFTRQNTISPLHGALIAAAVVNDGMMMEPNIIEELTTVDGKRYVASPKVFSVPIRKDTAEELKRMMHETVTVGTSQKVFRGMRRDAVLSQVFIGGKTGTLRGTNPVGHYDWFVGFGEHNDNKIAFAALCIHGEYYGRKASMIARRALEKYFRKIVPVYVQR